MRKSAEVYERKGTLFVSASHRTQAGFWIGDEEVSVLSDPTPELVEAAVKSALILSQDGVPTPPPTAKLGGSLLSAAGVSSWATFMNLSKLVDVHQQEGEWRITPYRNLGRKEGFEPYKEQEVTLACSSGGLGQAVLVALQSAS